MEVALIGSNRGISFKLPAALRIRLFWLWTMIFLSAAGVLGCSTTSPARVRPAYQEIGLASYYGHKFHGRRTASGEHYNERAMTAAHPSLPFGTMVSVFNLENRRTVQVRINDRGPFIKGRIIDLSYAAARQLGMLHDGVVRVRITATIE